MELLPDCLPNKSPVRQRENLTEDEIFDNQKFMNAKELFLDKSADAPTDKKFIGVGELSRRWAISPSAIYGFKAGTHRLKRYRFGRSIKFLLVDVEHIEQSIINDCGGKK